MALEDRVRALEQEVNILKDEVRNILIEIQEQILIHYYPDLRGEESKSSIPALPARANGASKAERPSAGVRRVRIEDTPPVPPVEAEAPEEYLDAVPKPAVALEQALRAAVEETPPLPKAGGNGRRAGMRQLLVWASDSVTSIGRERTLKAIEMAVAGGYLDSETGDLLLHLAGLCDGEPSTEQVDLKAVVTALLNLDKILEDEAGLTVVPPLAEGVGVG